MRNSHIIALLVAVVVVIVAIRLMRAPEMVADPRIGDLEGTVKSLRAQLDETVSGIEIIGARVRQDVAQPAVSVPELDRPVELVEGASRGELEEAVAQLAQEVAGLTDRLTKLEQQLVARSAVPFIVTPGRGTETEEQRVATVETNQTTALDSEKTVEERLAALRNLRFRNGRSHDVTMAMIGLIEDPAVDASTRADIIRNLDGVEFEELKAPLLHALQNDTSPEVRSESVETLQAFYADPAVHAAVSHVRDNDEDRNVREEAQERLSRFDRVANEREER